MELVPTFHCIGISWYHADGSPTNTCSVQYKVQGTETWSDALPLWWDTRTDSPYLTPEYRGSIVNLQPNTTYDIKLTLDSGPTDTDAVATWSEAFPIGETIEMPANSSTALNITQSGTASGYRLYRPSGASATLDVNEQSEYCIRITASYVIIRGLTLRGATNHAITVEYPAHDVVIEECDISDWGSSNMHSAVFVGGGGERDPVDPVIDRLIIQRNKIHDAKFGGTNWDQGSPNGPYGITFRSAGSNHVIRYNEIVAGTSGHYYKDGIGGSKNRSYRGCPNADSDIYANIITHCWDDGIEAEGGNENVRIWGNYIDHTYVKIAIASTSVGPAYVWRNVLGMAEKSPAKPGNGIFIKAGGGTADAKYYGDGAIYMFHNTVLQPGGHGPHGGIHDSGGDIRTMQTRNNVLYINGTGQSIRDNDQHASNDFDYDLYNGDIVAVAGSEANGIEGTPIFSGTGYGLTAASPGYDDGVVIDNFNDGYSGSGPDMGAQEAGASLLEFGVDAYTETLPSISVNKTASPTSVIEPGGSVDFVVRVNNTGSLDVSLIALTDSVYGNLHGKGDCSIPQDISAGNYYECSFTEEVQGTYPASETNIVSASAEDAEANPAIAQDSCTVTIEQTPAGEWVTIYEATPHEFNHLDTGPYEIVQEEAPEWELTNIDVTSQSHQLITRGVIIDLGADEDASVEFDNALRGSIRALMQTIPSGSTQAFSIALSGDASGSAILRNHENKTWYGLSSGTYQVVETVPAGWELTSVECDAETYESISNGVEITLASMEQCTVTFNNTKLGSITVSTDLTPDTPAQSMRIRLRKL